MIMEKFLVANGRVSRRIVMKKKSHRGHTLENSSAVSLISVADKSSQISEQYRTIRTNIQFALSADQQIQTIVVTSSGPSEGKSTTAANLAVVLADSGQKVLLIDADMRKPTVHETFSLLNSNGLSMVLTTKLVISMLYHKVPWKGSDIGLQVINKLMDDYPEIEVLVFGVAARPNELREEITYFENPSVDDLREKIYNKSMIYLMTSRSEGWGLTATEAMACGAALVTTDSGGVGDFAINNETALVTAIDDVTDLVNKAEALIDDPALRYKLIDNGLAVVKKFNIEYSYKKFEHVIAGLNRNELS